MTETPDAATFASSPQLSTPNDSPDVPATETPGSDLATMPGGNLADRVRYAGALATAGDLIPAGLRNGREPNVGKVLLAIETGSMLGVHPVAAINGINIIDGKATLSPALMSGIVRRAGHKLRVRTTGVLEEGTLKAVATLVRADDPDAPFEAAWTPARAARAGLCTYTEEAPGRWALRARSNSGKVLPWEAYTEAMLKARAIGEVCREGAEDALMGVHYTPEELGATVDADGVMVELGMVEAQVVEPTPEAIAADALTRATTATDVPTLVGVWNALPQVVVRYSWAGQYADLKDYATRTLVTVGAPYAVEPQRVTLLAAFGMIRAHLERGGDDAPQETPAPAGDDGDTTIEPDEHPAPAAPVEDVHDAEVIDTPTGDDPWADGSAQAGNGHPDDAPLPGSRHNTATALVADRLGGEVIADEHLTRAQAVAAEHAEDVATAHEARKRDTTPTTAPAAPDGPGRAALAQARAELETRNATRIEREAQARRAGKAGKP